MVLPWCRWLRGPREGVRGLLRAGRGAGVPATQVSFTVEGDRGELGARPGEEPGLTGLPFLPRPPPTPNPACIIIPHARRPQTPPSVHLSCGCHSDSQPRFELILSASGVIGCPEDVRAGRGFVFTPWSCPGCSLGAVPSPDITITFQLK